MRSIRILPAVVTVAVIPSYASAIRFELDSKSATCSGEWEESPGDPFASVSISSKCSAIECRSDVTLCNKDPSNCELGDIVQLEGSLTAVKPFANNQVVLKRCLAGVCPKRYSMVDGRVCDWIAPVSDDIYCGEAGDYRFVRSVKIPDESSVQTGTGWIYTHLTMTIHVQKEQGCSMTWSDVKRQLPYPLMGALAFVGVLILLYRAVQDGKELEDEETFVEDLSYVELGSATSNQSSANKSTLISSALHHKRLSSDEDVYRDNSRKLPLQSQFSPVITISQNPVQDSQMDTISEISAASYSPPLDKQPALPNNEKSIQVEKSQSNQQPPHKYEISMDVLRQWYQQHGVAIV